MIFFVVLLTLLIFKKLEGHMAPEKNLWHLKSPKVLFRTNEGRKLRTEENHLTMDIVENDH